MKKYYTLIKNARIFDPSEKSPYDSDILIDKQSGLIERIGEKTEPSEEDVVQLVDAGARPVCRTFTDLFSHVSEASRPYEKGMASTAGTALAGGYGDIVALPEIKSGIREESFVEGIKAREGTFPCRILPGASLFSQRGLARSRAEYRSLYQKGAVVFSDEGLTEYAAGALKSAMEICAEEGFPLVLKARDAALFGKGVISRGQISGFLNLPEIAESSEELAVARALILSKDTGCPIHLACLSLKSSLEMVRRAKAEGVRVTCSVTPESFSLLENDLMFYGNNVKLDPPIRSEENRRAVIEAIADRTVDAIVSNHTPCSQEEKKGNFISASFGAVTLQTVLSCCVTYLLMPGYIDLMRLVELLTSGPSSALGKACRIAEGERADLNILSLDREVKITSAYLRSESQNSPYLSRELTGEIKTVILGGIVLTP